MYTNVCNLIKWTKEFMFFIQSKIVPKGALSFLLTSLKVKFILLQMYYPLKKKECHNSVRLKDFLLYNSLCTRMPVKQKLSNHWTFMWILMHKVPNNIVLQNRKCLVAKYTSRICMLNFMLVIGLKNQKVTKLMKLAFI